MSKTNKQFKYILALLALLPSHFAFSELFVDVEVGVFKPKYNKVQIPNDNKGDRFDIADIGNDAIVAPRVTLGWIVAENHELQFVLAPFAYTQTGSVDENVRFAGKTFSSNFDVKARYQFSSYRIRYLYRLVDSEHWKTDLGATLFIRDASIKLSQNGKSSEDDNIGAVPLFAFRTAYAFNKQWSLLLDTDVAIAPQGRALDLALLAEYRLGEKWKIAGGYRTIEGGADNDEVYNFAWFNGLTMKASYAW